MQAFRIVEVGTRWYVECSNFECVKMRVES
jgi:hypothetical protein